MNSKLMQKEQENLDLRKQVRAFFSSFSLLPWVDECFITYLPVGIEKMPATSFSDHLQPLVLASAVIACCQRHDRVSRSTICCTA